MLNNKGMTLVELIITFALLMAVVVGLYNLIIEVKFQMEEREIAKDINSYSSTVNHSVHYSMLKTAPNTVYLKTARNESWVQITPNVTGEDEEPEKTLDVDDVVKIGDVNIGTSEELSTDYCHLIYPCLVYDSADKKTIGVIALFNREALGLPNFLQGRDYGILYGEKIITETTTDEEGETSISGTSSSVVFDPLPDPTKVDPIKFAVSPTNKDAQTYITYYKEEKMIVINYPIFIIDNPKNYGFRIAYSFVR